MISYLPTRQLVLALGLILASVEHADAAIYLAESMSSTIGPTANASGNTISASSAVGYRFQVGDNATTGRIGGFFSQFAAGGLYGAIVRLSGPADFPDTLDLSSADVLGGVVLNAPIYTGAPGTGPSIVSANLNVNLTPGEYALVFGSGAFGATGVGSLAYPGATAGTLPGFVTSGSGWTNSDLGFGYMFLTAAEISSSIDIPAGDAGPLNVLQATSAGGGLSVDLSNTTGGTFSSSFRQLTPTDILASGEEYLQHTTFAITGPTFQIWDIEFSGQLLDPATLVFGYDESQLANDIAETDLGIFHWVNGAWVKHTGILDTVNNTITVHGVTSFSPWALGASSAVVPAPSSITLWVVGGVVALGGHIRLRKPRGVEMRSRRWRVV